MLIDANLLLLLIVGLTSRSYIAKHAKLKAYSAAAFDLLCEHLPSEALILVTPNVLTEASNLLAYDTVDPRKTELFTVFRHFIDKATEEHVDSRIAAADPGFARLGLTDTGILALKNAAVTLLTADVALYVEASRKGMNAINFNHLRERFL